MRNIAFALGGQILNILMSFAMRTVFVNTLGEVYLGVNGLFTNILMVFSLADLGVGTAIIYAMYKPVAEHDTRKIQGAHEYVWAGIPHYRSCHYRHGTCDDAVYSLSGKN